MTTKITDIDGLKAEAFDVIKKILAYSGTNGILARERAEEIADNTDASDCLLDAITGSYDCSDGSKLSRLMVGSVIETVESFQI